MSQQISLALENSGVSALPSKAIYEARVSDAAEDILAAQKLRHDIFASEMGARLNSPVPGLDVDCFDQYCRHVMVHEAATGKLVATTRILDNAGAAALGGFYSAGEFEFERIDALPGPKLEIGRSCVHADYRNGAVIGILWKALMAVVVQEDIRWLFGCASIRWQDQDGDGVMVEAIMERFRNRYMAAKNQRVTALQPVPAVSGGNVTALRIPPLLKAYVSLGARIGGEPAWDRDFGVADLFMILDIQNLDRRYARRFMTAADETRSSGVSFSSRNATIGAS